MMKSCCFNGLKCGFTSFQGQFFFFLYDSQLSIVCLHFYSKCGTTFPIHICCSRPIKFVYFFQSHQMYSVLSPPVLLEVFFKNASSTNKQWVSSHAWLNPNLSIHPLSRALTAHCQCLTACTGVRTGEAGVPSLVILQRKLENESLCASVCASSGFQTSPPPSLFLSPLSRDVAGKQWAHCVESWQRQEEGRWSEGMESEVKQIGGGKMA